MILNLLKRNKPASPVLTAVETEVLETDKKLSECLIWQLMEDYYQQGVDAWQSVPFHATSNAYIAKSYAELVIHFLLDYEPHLDKTEPIYILEMAAGTGSFSFHLVRELLKQQQKFSALTALQIRYVMADFSQATIDSWKAQPGLMNYMDAGVLDFALFYPEDETQLFLQHSQHTISAGTVKNPLIALANYFFDSLRQDLFQIDNHALQETRVNVERPKQEAPLAVSQVSLIRHHHDIQGEYYPDKHMNALLQEYSEYFEEGSIIFPVSSFQVIRNLEVLSGNNLVLISSDKGFTDINFMQGKWDHGYALHGGAFSYMVNYHAIRRYFEHHGGITFGTQDQDYALTTTVNIRLKNPVELNQLSYYFDQYFDTTNLINNLSNQVESLRRAHDLDAPGVIRASLSLVRLSNYDPGIFWCVGERLCRSVGQINTSQKLVLLDMLEKVLAQYYASPVAYNALAWIGAIYYELDHVEKAQNIFLESIRIYGENANTGVVYYIALSYECQEQFDTALYYLEVTQKLDPAAKFVQKDIARVKDKKKTDQKKAA